MTISLRTLKCWETFKWNLAYRSNYQHHHTNHERWHKADETKVANLTQIAPGPVLEVDKLVDLDIQGVGRNTMQTTMQAPPECICSIFYYRNREGRIHTIMQMLLLNDIHFWAITYAGWTCMANYIILLSPNHGEVCWIKGLLLYKPLCYILGEIFTLIRAIERTKQLSYLP
jgi:hypothetical protein